MPDNIMFKRRFTTDGVSPYDEIKWEKFDAVIKDFKTGEIVFEQKDVEFPLSYSQQAVNIITSKYFRGVIGTKKREKSYKQLIKRVVDTNVKWGEEQGYFVSEGSKQIFEDELTHILLNQKAYFNSPVWFNMGWEHREQTASACFIVSLEDNMDSILDFNKREGRIFKAGSGSGANFSTLRSKYETLSTGGYSSGAISFMKVADANAGSIKSGGATRRAAKMVILNSDHPEIVEFIQCKVKEEEKAFALIREGYDPSYNGEAYGTVCFQNGNHSIRVTDDFMEAVKKDKDVWTKMVTTGKKFKSYKAKEILRLISEATWKVGDPGLQFHDIINDMNCCKTDECLSTNPCSEYTAQTDTSCNLSSINLMKCMDLENKEFLIDDFHHICWIMSTAMDIWIEKADYPDELIAEKTKLFRTVGLGYANLGALIMANGWAYDSDEGRAAASAITSLMTASVYERSANHCQFLPPFPKWEDNQKSMIDVLKKHQRETKTIDKTNFTKNIIKKANEVWLNAISDGSENGFRNSFATLMAPTGTIGLAMDCDTTGCEPVLGLTTYKLLAGANVTIEMINQTVEIALKTLEYSEKDIEKIKIHIKTHNSIDECDLVKKEHISIFDTSLKAKGDRFINHMGHLKMLGAIQPFLSGGISKTINMPNDATVEDIMDAYIKTWEMGIKCVAIYRDESKGSQPLTTIKEKRSRATRVRLPDDVSTKKHKFTVNGQDVSLHHGVYPDGTLGEIYVATSQQGSTMRGLMDSWAILFSIALQYGVPLKELVRKFMNTQFEPYGFTAKKDIQFCSSIVDYIVKYLAYNYLSDKEREALGINGRNNIKGKKITKENNEDTSDVVVNKNIGSMCNVCGSLMRLNGSCKLCPMCGHTTGCS